MDYTELIKRLRNCASDTVEDCAGCPYQGGYKGGYCMDGLISEAADTIEELQEDNTALNGTVSNLIQQIAGLSKPRWIPVTERLPEPGTPCLCWCKGGTYGQIRWYGLYYLTSHRTWAFYDNDCIINREVTHWMYRPEPPKEETE